MPQAIAYLGFNGNCAEALHYYERVLGLGANVELLITAGDTPMADQVPPEFRDRIVHGRLAFADGSCLYAGDAPAGVPYQGMKGCSITLNYPTVAEAERAFNDLTEGGTVTMPSQPTFWAKSCGMLTDRFGTAWIINGELQGNYAN